MIDTTPPKRKSTPAATPRYVQIRNSLRRSIADGEYAVAQALPSENELSRMFGASRVTVRHALAELQKEHLVESQRGKGHFVSRPVVVQPLSRLFGLKELAQDHGLSSRSTVISAETVLARQEIASGLDVEIGSEVFELRRLRYLNEKPFSLDVSYFPVEIGRAIAACDLENNDVFFLLESEVGLELGLADIRIELASATSEIAAALETDEGAAMLQLTRKTSTVDGEPVDFEFVVGRGDAFQFQVTVARC